MSSGQAGELAADGVGAKCVRTADGLTVEDGLAVADGVPAGAGAVVAGGAPVPVLVLPPAEHPAAASRAPASAALNKILHGMTEHPSCPLLPCRVLHTERTPGRAACLMSRRQSACRHGRPLAARTDRGRRGTPARASLPTPTRLSKPQSERQQPRAINAMRLPATRDHGTPRTTPTRANATKGKAPVARAMATNRRRLHWFEALKKGKSECGEHPPHRAASTATAGHDLHGAALRRCPYSRENRRGSPSYFGPIRSGPSLQALSSVT
jgi:hypothetical protein